MKHIRRLTGITLILGTLAAGAALRPKAGDQIPLAINDLVLRELNALQTPDGQRSYRNAVTRLPIYRAMIDAAIAGHGMPRELIAVPFIESGFQNIPSVGNHSAGLWQIMPETGRRLGLVVDDHIDERLDEVRATDAALKYLHQLNEQFHDWRLALRAYNQGEVKVQQLIDELGTRDPWELERQAESPEHYLSRFTAVVYRLQSDGLL